VNAVYKQLTEATGLPSLALALGVFDGVHLGHRALLHAAVEEAMRLDAIPAALTFDPHPARALSPARAPLLLGTLPERIESLRACGVQEVLVAAFDREMAAQTPEIFIQQVLIGRLNTKAIIIGEDFRFGCDRKGDVAYLRAAGERFGFEVRALSPVFVGGVPARSTTIRQMLSGGQVAEASRLLGRDYSLRGEVVHGRKLGRTLGFPTANIARDPQILVPADGVYAGYATLENGARYRTAISVGTNPTVAITDSPRTVEAYLMDGFDGDLYGQILDISFAHFLRPTLKFDGLDALITQMRLDVREAESLLDS
jgi:riboflavin kinase/FMN adenylyltransferase